ncbi:MAG TPA: 2OG-Fe(II) oxygenase [Pyrinomonadaceae bacterium]|nr:2OG-Fe(II) oxygenase [Pyrinomonadaceae bacterium]
MSRNGSGVREAVYVEEVRGVLSLQLFGARAARDLLARVRKARGWEFAPVGVEEPDGGYGVVEAPEDRSASALAPGRRSQFEREFDALMDGVVKPLTNNFWGTSLTRHASTHFVRYSPGDFYLPHTDTTPEEDYRYFTVLCYLNDDFGGGQTSFLHLGHAVEPRAGKAIIFPSSYLHGAEPVTAGEKYVVVSWLTGLAPVSWL